MAKNNIKGYTYGDTPQPTYVCDIDSTFVTLLITFGYSGLEIQNENDDWVKVAPRPGSLVVNIGKITIAFGTKS